MSSRIIVKNLPRHYNDHRFREHFSEKGTVTDAKIMKTRIGTSRMFGFIGYKTPEEALAAVTYFNGTFIDTSKITVELAKSVGDSSLVPPIYGSSRTPPATSSDIQPPSSASSLDQPSSAPLSSIDALLKDTKENKRLKEFLDIMKPKALSKTWQNDDGAGLDVSTSPIIASKDNLTRASSALPNTSASSAIENDNDLYEDMVKKSDSKTPEIPILDVITTASNADWLKSKVADDVAAGSEPTKVLDSSPPPTSTTSDTINAVEQEKLQSLAIDAPNKFPPTTDPPKQMQQDDEIDASISIKDQVMNTGRLFVRNLCFTCNEQDLQDLFSPFGVISEIHIPVDSETKMSKGFAHVMFMLPEEAYKAFTKLDKIIFQGRLLHLLPGKEKYSKPLSTDDSTTAATSFKQKRLQEQKDQSRKEVTWNTLFMSSDAVAESMARKLHVNKGDLFDPENNNMAVRMALAETHIIQETIEYLEKEGVAIDVFREKKSKAVARSDTVLLIKNIPYSTEAHELLQLFNRFGDILRLVIPPTKTIALIEFSTMNEAKSAFNAMAFKNFGGRPLLLEKAPLNVFRTPADANSLSKYTQVNPSVHSIEPSAEKSSVELVVAGSTTDAVSALDEDLRGAGGDVSTTIYVKNLNFVTLNDSLTSLFSSLPNFRSAKVSMKKDVKHVGKMLSMGFGFVEFFDGKSAASAVHRMQNVLLDGHALQLKLSTGSNLSAKTNNATTKTPSTKLLVRNVPFEATRKDILELFSAFGQVKRVRVPKKIDNRSHRGFAFVDFVTKQEATNAYQNLFGTHIYGRHLVLEWAEDDESVETIRKRAQHQIHGLDHAENSLRSRQRLDLGDDQIAGQ